MRLILLIAILFIAASSYAQDSIKIVQKIDSIWAHKIKVKGKNIPGTVDGVFNRVWYSKTGKDVVQVRQTIYPAKEEPTRFWIYNYHFRNDKLIFITKYNNTGYKDPRRKICYYYFQDGSLIYKHEFRTAIADIDSEVQKAYALAKRFENPEYKKYQQN